MRTRQAKSAHISEVPDPVGLPSIAPLTMPEPSLEERFLALEQRLESLERQAHTEHTIGQETLDSIAAHVVRRLNEHLRQMSGGVPQEP